MTHTKCSPGLIRSCLLFAVALTLAVPASAAWKEKVLYSFQGGTNDGSVPIGGVVSTPMATLRRDHGWWPGGYRLFSITAHLPTHGDPWARDSGLPVSGRGFEGRPARLMAG